MIFELGGTTYDTAQMIALEAGQQTICMSADFKDVFIMTFDHWTGVRVERASEAQIRYLSQRHPELLKALEGKIRAGG